MKKIYFIRHCEAEGQASEAPLTERGMRQADDLAEFFSKVNIDQIISSPYRRALQTIEPLAKRINIKIKINEQLKERVLSQQHLEDWLNKLKLTFDNMELKFEGGESSQEATKRIVEVVDDVFNSEISHTIIVTHGNLLALFLNHLNQEFGFDEWKSLRNPEVFLIKRKADHMTYEWIER